MFCSLPSSWENIDLWPLPPVPPITRLCLLCVTDSVCIYLSVDSTPQSRRRGPQRRDFWLWKYLRFRPDTRSGVHVQHPAGHKWSWAWNPSHTPCFYLYVWLINFWLLFSFITFTVLLLISFPSSHLTAHSPLQPSLLPLILTWSLTLAPESSRSSGTEPVYQVHTDTHLHTRMTRNIISS